MVYEPYIVENCTVRKPLEWNAFAAVSQSTSLGGIVSFVGRSFSEVCYTEPGFAEVCSKDNLGDAAKVLSVAAGVMF